MITDGEPDIRAGDLGGLSEQECRRLLSTRTLGRVGLTSGALPVIMPVEYVYEAGVITFRTAHDAKLRAAEQGDVLAFEVDAYDAASGHGWSVHVLGRATVQADDCDVAPLPMLDVEPHGEHHDEKAAQPRHHYVRLHCEILTGRRLVSSRE